MDDYEIFAKSCENLSAWASEPDLLPIFQREIARLNEQLDRNPGDGDLRQELCDRFYTHLPFNGSVTRALTGVGSGRMNIYTVRQLAQAAALVLKSKDLSAPAVAIGYDCRPFSDRFALELSGVFLANSIGVHLFSSPSPASLLAFATRQQRCALGIFVSGGHLPSGYSGLELYASGGCPLPEESMASLENVFARIDPFSDVKCISADLPEFQTVCGADGVPLLSIVPSSVTDDFCTQIRTDVGPAEDAHLQVIYTTMNGVGGLLLPRLLQEAGVEHAVPVPEQQKADGSFVTCSNPDPSKQESLRTGLAQCERAREADLLLAVSPDCGTFGCAVKDSAPKEGKGSYVHLSGNQTGVLMLDYLCQTGKLPAGSILYKTQVVTPMADDIAGAYGITVQTFATDFRAVSQMLAKSGSATPFFAFDGSGSYRAAPSLPDRDGLSAALLVAQMASYYKRRGKTLLTRLEELSREYGFYTDRELEFRYEGESAAVLDDVMRQLAESYVDAEGVRIFVRSSKAESKVKVNVALRKDSKEEAAKAMNQAEFTIRGRVKEWLHAIKH